MDVERLLALLPSERCLVRLKPCHRGPYRSRKRSKLSPQALLDYLVTHRIRTTRELRKLRPHNEACPFVHDYFAAFGCWSTAVELAYGKQVLTQPPPNDPDYVAKCVTEFDLWTQTKYLATRRLQPGVIPSARQVRRVWGNFGNLFFAARKMSAKKTFEDYLRLERRLGRLPTAMECKQADLDLSPLRELLGSKWDIDDLLAYRTKADRIKAG